MRKISLLLPVILLFLSGCTTPRAFVSSMEAGNESIIRSSFSPDMTDRMELHENSGIFYKFEHDRDNLYLVFATSDETVKRKIAYFGLTVWIDREGKKDKKQGFRFPKGFAAPQNDQGVRVQVPAQDMAKLLEIADEIDLIGIYGNSVRTVKRRDSQVRADARIIDDMLVYKAVVPFGLLKHGYSPLNGKQTMSIGLETGHQETSAPDRRGREMDGRRPGGGIYPPGMGGMQGPYQGRMIERQMEDRRNETGNLSRPTRLWLDLEFLPAR
jgi:hypothetical protein